MSAYNKTLQLLASRLGLGDEAKVMRKAAEYERLLQTKSTTGSNISDTSKVIICLDLAASYFGAEVDKTTAIKYSGLKPAQYSKYIKIVENLLDLNHDKLTTNYLCLSLQCPSVQELADKILREYQMQAKVEVDLNLPHYVCMAVHQACRIKKVKVPKSKFVEKSRLKSSQWSKLDAEWTKFVDEKFASSPKKSKSNKTVEDVEQKEEAMEIDSDKTESIEPEIEPYEIWRARMLALAYKELEEQSKEGKYKDKKLKTVDANNEDNIEIFNQNDIEVYDDSCNKDDVAMSPRRSPRKTPVKYSPYKTPSRPNNGVRLLFPLD